MSASASKASASRAPTSKLLDNLGLSHECSDACLFGLGLGRLLLALCLADAKRVLFQPDDDLVLEGLALF